MRANEEVSALFRDSFQGTFDEGVRGGLGNKKTATAFTVAVSKSRPRARSGY
jgi:hypothetical protein